MGGCGGGVVVYWEYLEGRDCELFVIFDFVNVEFILCVQVPESEHVSVLMKLCDSSTDAQFKVKCIGTLECLAQHGPSIDANLVRLVQFF